MRINPRIVLRLATAFLLTLLAGGALPLRAADSTAFELIKEGNRYVGEHARDKVVQIRSDKSVGGLTPNIWYVVYYDQTATMKAVEVKFGAGKMMDVKRPMRLLEPISGDHRMLNQDKLKVDSDKALKTASKEPLLEKLTLKASQLWLRHGIEGPEWRVKLWAAKLDKPERMVDIGDVIISADKGEVLKSDLRINRID